MTMPVAHMTQTPNDNKREITQAVSLVVFMVTLATVIIVTTHLLS